MLSYCVYVYTVQGMVDPGERVSQTLQREFSEEALNSLQAPPEERKQVYERISKLFGSPGFQVRNELYTVYIKLTTQTSLLAVLYRVVLVFLLRCIKVMLMTQETQTIHGWKPLLLTFMMKQVIDRLH